MSAITVAPAVGQLALAAGRAAVAATTFAVGAGATLLSVVGAGRRSAYEEICAALGSASGPDDGPEYLNARL